MFMFLVIIHELGHFYAAKKTGVHVKEFGIGIPPKAAVVAKDKRGTEYTINWLPLGGFVRLKGEDPEVEADFFAKDSFISASLINKIIILVAWVAVNTVFAWLAFSWAFWVGVSPITILPDSAMKQTTNSYLMPTQSSLIERGLMTQTWGDRLVVDRVVGWSLGKSLWMQDGDVIVSINDQKMTPVILSKTLQSIIGEEFTMKLERQSVPITVSWTCPNDNCVLGVVISWVNTGDLTIKMPLGKALVAWLQEIKAQTVLTFSTLGTLWANLFSFEADRISSSVDKLSWPVGIVAFWQRLFYDQGWVSFLAFAGIISLALAIFNILPIPALDWWRIVTAIIQSIGQFSPKKYFIWENYVNIFFFILLMALGLFVIYKDIIRL